MVGVTSTYLTYSIAFAYMANERVEELVWALNRLKGLLINKKNLPKVIVTDKDNALVNAVEEVFPTSRHFAMSITHF
jgi:alpha-glucosidase